MISAANISLAFGQQKLFKDVNIKFTPGNCYGVIGANGSGKSTFLKILSGELESDTGEIVITPGERIAVLRQDHFAFNEYSVMETVIMGHRKLYEIMNVITSYSIHYTKLYDSWTGMRGIPKPSVWSFFLNGCIRGIG